MTLNKTGTTALDAILAKYIKGCYGVRLTYYSHILSTCAYHTTADNLLACLRALAALEACADASQMADVLLTEQDNLKIELYTAS